MRLSSVKPVRWSGQRGEPSGAEKPAPLYSGARQFEYFCRMADFYPHVAMPVSNHKRPFPVGDAIELPETYEFDGQSRRVPDLIEATDTSALLVIQNGQLRHQQYWLTGGETVRWTSWSVAKSFISALVGIAVEQGAIRSIDDAISDYWPAMKGSAYDGVPIRHVLQMSSGARWNEDYSDPKSDVNQLGAVMAGQQTLDDFVCGIVSATTPGTVCQYNSADTQALGMLLRGATGVPLSEYMSEKLLEPLGMEDSAYWITDQAGVEMVLGGLSMTARDFAKIGELYRNNGRIDQRQVVPETWVKASTVASSPHLQPGKVIVGGHAFAFGYGYQWWIPEGNRGEFSAIGVYNQFVFVDPPSKSVVVKLSANPAYGTSPEEADNKDEENLVMLQAICRSLG